MNEPTQTTVWENPWRTIRAVIVFLAGFSLGYALGILH
jgi:hypothetical protein